MAIEENAVERNGTAMSLNLRDLIENQENEMQGIKPFSLLMIGPEMWRSFIRVSSLPDPRIAACFEREMPPSCFTAVENT